MSTAREGLTPAAPGRAEAGTAAVPREAARRPPRADRHDLRCRDDAGRVARSGLAAVMAACFSSPGREHCERLWLRPRAELLAEAGVEVRVLWGRRAAPCLSRPGVFAGIVGHGIG